MRSTKKISETTVILLFAQSEQVERNLKPIAHSSKQNVLFWKKMNERVLTTVQKTKLPYFISNEHNQVGTTFGEKITHAIQKIFAKGFEKVIVVGNDCVALNQHHLQFAIRNLQHHACVLGPDNNGGAYLIGISKSAFNTAHFKNIPWQTKSVFSALRKLYSEQSVACLPHLDDCNSASDFKKAIHRLPFHSALKNVLLSFLWVPKVQMKSDRYLIGAPTYAVKFNKGSPSLYEVQFR